MAKLITGGAGFIGSHVAEFVDDAIILDDLSGGFEENIPKHCRFIQGSVCDKPLVNAIFRDNQITHVYHFAAFAAEVYSPYVPHHNYTTNVIGSVNLVSAAIRHNIERFVFCSSIAVYGDRFPMREDVPPCPRDPYGIAKYAIELHLASAQHEFGLEYTIFRPHNVYGERQNMGDATRNVVGIFMQQAMTNMPMTVYGDGTQRRAFTYVRDIAGIMAESVYNEAYCDEVFNIGTDEVRSVNDIAEVVAKQLGVEQNTTHLPKRNEAVDAWADHSKISTIAQAPQTSVSDGIAKMAAWAKTTGGQKTVPKREPEIGNPRHSNDTTCVRATMANRAKVPSSVGWTLDTDNC
jgi:UDP-glucose 4-epimerase